VTRLTWPIRRTYRVPALSMRGREFAWGARTYVMGIINVTPDSFSGDGIGHDLRRAVALAKAFEGDGADILDVGGESSRPGAEPVAAEEECRRVVPAIQAIREATGLPVSVDTYHAKVAEAALAAGADMVNDISGLRAEAEMANVVARHGGFRDVIGDVRSGFEATLEIAEAAGISPGRVMLDPGFGFGWTPEQNLELLRRLPELWPLEMPLLVGTSRKSTIGLVLDAPVEGRLEGTAASVAATIAAGADIVRVHDVRAMVRVAKVTDAIVRGTWSAS
jgi:dihydropteroate synthase